MAKSFLLILCLLHVFAGRAASAVANHRVLPFHQDVYVWQRDWNGPMRDALRMRGTTFHSVVALKAEVTWQDRQPVTTKIDLDYPLLTNVTRHPGLALRIGPVAWPFMGTNRVAADYLANLAARIVQESREAGLPLSELQVDYDCASSKLEDYAALVSYLKARIAPVPLVITALPDWIGKTGFGPLINAVDGFVLQVHSVQKPISFDAPFSLCDPAQAEYAINAAANYNKPFRVALPTYGYEMAFNADGRYIGLSAEGPRRTWPEGTRKEEVRANPLEIGRLALKLRQKRPEQLQGLIWSPCAKTNCYPKGV